MDVVRRCHVAAIRLSCSLRMYVVSYYNLCRDATRVRLLVRDSILGYLQLMLSSTCDHLFEIHNDGEKMLPEEQAQAFHHTVAQLLFLCRRTRPDIQTAVSFICTRVQKPDEDDWGKLKRCLKYLKGTFHMKLNLAADGSNTMQWWVDASYAVHWDCKGHTGMMLSLGRGASCGHHPTSVAS